LASADRLGYAGAVQHPSAIAAPSEHAPRDGAHAPSCAHAGRAARVGVGDARTRLLASALIVLALPAAWAQSAAAAPPAAGSSDAGDEGQADGDEVVGAAPISEWDDAVNSFRYQDFDTAIPRLRKLLYPKPHLERAREWKAREFLGAALWWTGKKQEALDELTALLVRNPAARLDPASYPPQMIKDFASLRSNLVRLGVIREGQKPAPPTRKRPRYAAPLAVCLFPFGAGQFANDQTGKGVAFLAGQLALGTTSVLLYQHNRDEGRAGSGDSALRVTQVATGALFWGLAAWGVVDALMVRSDIIAEARANLRAPEAGTSAR
jgi:hypothetical protein